LPYSFQDESLLAYRDTDVANSRQPLRLFRIHIGGNVFGCQAGGIFLGFPKTITESDKDVLYDDYCEYTHASCAAFALQEL
jgi:hypothetical protein